MFKNAFEIALPMKTTAKYVIKLQSGIKTNANKLAIAYCE